MWRAIFLALGGTLLVMGIESLVLDHAVLSTDNGFISPPASTTEPVFDEWGFEIDRKVVPGVPKTIHPPEWAPWSMLSSGTVILLYAFGSKIRGTGGE